MLLRQSRQSPQPQSAPTAVSLRFQALRRAEDPQRTTNPFARPNAGVAAAPPVPASIVLSLLLELEPRLEVEPQALELQPLPARIVVSAAVWAPGPRAQVQAQRPVQRRVQEPA